MSSFPLLPPVFMFLWLLHQMEIFEIPLHHFYVTLCFPVVRPSVYLRNALREFPQIWYKRPCRLIDRLIRF